PAWPWPSWAGGEGPDRRRSSTCCGSPVLQLDHMGAKGFGITSTTPPHRQYCSRASAGPTSMHGTQLVVQIFRREIGAVIPRDRREPVIEVELGKAQTVPQRLEILAVEIVGEVHHALASIVEFQPNLVVPEVPRIDHNTLHLLVTGQSGLL